MTAAILQVAPQSHWDLDLTSWFVEQALPFWATQGWDDVHGGVHERMLWDGKPDLLAHKRVRVQARQIYVYSYAAAAGWYPDKGRFALNLFDWMHARAWSPDGQPGYVHLLQPDGSVANPLRDTYDHMFIIMGLAWLARATGDAQVRAHLDEVIGFVDEHLTAPDGTLFEGVPRTLPRRQNPHMHAFEAMLVLHETLAYPGALERAERIRGFLEERFLYPAPILREFFGDDWQPMPDLIGETVEPGHQAEWAWLLRWHERITAYPPSLISSQLLDGALKGINCDRGFLVDEVDCHGKFRRVTRRLWPQTELAKALICEAEIGRSGALQAARSTISAIKEEYLAKPIGAGWLDQFNADGSIAVETIPASTLYHIMGLVVEAYRVRNTLDLGIHRLHPQAA